MDTNREHFAEGVHVAQPLPAALLDLLYDPQTSGGLLFFVGEPDAPAALQALRQAGVQAVEIGHAGRPTGHVIEID